MFCVDVCRCFGYFVSPVLLRLNFGLSSSESVEHENRFEGNSVATPRRSETILFQTCFTPMSNNAERTAPPCVVPPLVRNRCPVEGPPRTRRDR
eukprot:6356013-Heterocapsa_arctica.AAC.1